MDAARKALEPDRQSVAWVAAFAVPSVSPADAKEALSALSPFGPLRPFAAHPTLSGQVGRVYMLAAEGEQALPFLLSENRWCGTPVTSRSLVDVDWMIQRFQDSFLLGQALEQIEDSKGACAAYKVVLERWAHAKPRSVTAEKAREQSRRLGCGK